jgi:translocation and assembly module TamA
MQVTRAAIITAFIYGFHLGPPALAQDGKTPDPVFPPLSSGELAPDSPLAPMPELEVPWPEIEDKTPLPGEVETTVSADEVERRYSVRLEGVDSIPGNDIERQFHELSSLEREAEKDADANAAQIDRRAREDVELLRDLLRARGYYEARVDRLITAAPDNKDRLLVTLNVDAGKLFTYSLVDVTGVEPPLYDKVRGMLKLQSGDPVDALKTQSAELGLKTSLPREGYVFSTVGAPDVVVDFENETGTYSIPVDPGPLARMGSIRVSGDRIFGPKHIGRIGRFDPGDVYDSADIDDLRRAIIATGLVSDVSITPVQGAEQVDGSVLADLDVNMKAAPMRTVAGSAGYDTGQGARVELSWQHRNLIRPEGAVTFRGVAGTKEQLVAAELRRSNFKRRDQVLNGRLAVQRQRLDAYDAETISIGGGIERQTNIIWQKKWVWALGAEVLATREKDNFSRIGLPDTRTYFIAALPARLAYDGSDDLLDPHRGFRLSARVSPELSLQSGQSGYVRTQLDASAYMPIGSDNYVLAGRLRFGQISGASLFSIAPSRRFYAGGGGSVRGYGYQAIGPKDFNNDPIGGRSLTEAAIEARIRFGNFGIVPFIDAGQLYTASLPRFSNMRYGAGIGVRYYSSFGPIRVDVGTPINPGPGDGRIAVYVSLGQAF